MEIFEAVFLGLIQGLTEFLPVSSSGHLVLFQGIFNIKEEVVFFDVMLHLATLLAVAVFFYRDIIGLFKPPFKTLLYLIIATVPAVIIMLLIKDYIDMLFGGSYLCFGFLVTAVLLFTTEILEKKHKGQSENIDGKKAFIMGMAQGLAVIPGISRSGSTICAGLLSGAKRESVAKFSFLMSMPIIAGSAAVSLLDSGFTVTIGAAPLILGMLAAFVSGMLAIKIMIKIIQKCNYKWFSLYLLLLSVLLFTDTYIVSIW